jgi:hypothetical protein
MKKLFVCVMASLCSAFAFAQTDEIVMEDVNLSSGGTETLYVKLKNPTKYTAFQFDLTLPKGVSVEGIGIGGNVPNTREKEYALINKETNTYRFLSYDMENANLDENASLKISLKAAEDAAEGVAETAEALVVTSDGTSTDQDVASANVTIQDENGVEITIGDAGKTTYVCDADLDFKGSGLTAYIVIGIEGTTLWMTPLDEVPAGTAVYVKGAKGTYKVNKTTLKKTYYKNLLIGNNSNEKLSVTPDGTNQYFYVGTKGFVRFTAERSIGAHKAYVCVAPLPAAKVGSGYPLTMSDAQRTSLCADVDLDFSDQNDLKAYTVIGYDGQIWMTQIDHVSAGTPLYVKGPKGEYTITSSAVQAVYANMLVGNNTNAAITIHPTDGEYSNYFIGKSGFSKVSSDRTVSAHKSYLQILTSYLSAGTRSVAEDVLGEIECEAMAVSIVDEDSETTGIRSITDGSSDDKWYDLKGNRISTPTKKGLYIKNGKKVIVK